MADAPALIGPAPLRITSRAVRLRGWRSFALAATSAGLAALALTVWLGFKIGGDGPTTAVSDVGQAIPALAAAATCGWASGRSAGRTRWAWGLLAASAGTWGAGEVVWSYYTVVLKVGVPFPSLADLGFLAAVPTAVAGVLCFPATATRGATRIRTLLDGAMVALSLLFVSWTLGLGAIYHQSQSGLLAQVIGLAYPVGDIVVLTALFVAFRRAAGSQRGQFALLIAGLAANAFSDSTFAFLTASGSYLTSSYLFSTGWIYGYALVALAPLWPRPRAERQSREGAMTVWRMMLPWLGLIAVLVTAIVLVAVGRPMDPFLTLPAAGLVVVLMASQALAFQDSLELLAASQTAELKLTDRSTMLNQVIDHAPQGVARIGIDRRLTNTNPKLAAILHTPAELLVGRSLEQFIPGDVLARNFGAFQSVSGDLSDTALADCNARRGDGSRFWLQWSVTPIRKLDGTIDYFMGMFEDITAKHEAAENAAATLSQLERLNRLKSEFVSSVSHEFRSALVGIQGFSELLRDSDMSPSEVHDTARDINNDAMRLNRMITEMLDLDRMEAGKIHLELKPLSLNDLVRNAVERARVTTDRHQVVTDLQPNISFVMGDSDRLTQVLTNLLSNAIKYSPDGGEISVRTRAGRGAVEVAVTDHGLGIPPEFISRLFGRYERFEDKNAGKILGTGLGLAITRQIVEMHGGTITVKSAVGSGSEFTLNIPTGVAPS
ncbi:MAG TPA: PAS domain-containing sensor histidine kinase [Candidatus Dormibacteraeota bacterium]|nr:PAS domain-containing sensor histidine kinase [Candidatus Dormibacteraeota bacterium]